MSPPRIKLRGSRVPIPPGYVVGRISAGRGDEELLNLQSLRQMGVAGTSDVSQAVSPAGFGFFAGGLLLAGELLGTAVFNHDVSFESADPADAVHALVAPTSTAVFSMKVGLTTVGTITFAGGSTVGVVAWTGGLYVLLTGVALSLYAPASADATLASVSGIVSGTKTT